MKPCCKRNHFCNLGLLNIYDKSLEFPTSILTGNTVCYDIIFPKKSSPSQV